jgi:hypothetical protein
MLFMEMSRLASTAHEQDDDHDQQDENDGSDADIHGWSMPVVTM